MKIIDTKKELIVKKDETLVYSRYQLNELALKVITFTISMLNKENTSNNFFSLPIKEFSELIGVSGRSIYENLEKAGKELMKGVLNIPKEDGGFLLINGWVSSFEYVPYKGIIKIELSQKLIPYIIDFKQKYLQYDLKNILKLRSSYSIRMYEILKDYYNTQNRYSDSRIEKNLTLEDLRNMLKIPKSYQYKDVKRRILEKSKIDLKEHTDIKFEFKEIKTGRKVTDLKFIIESNSKLVPKPKIKPYLKTFKAFTDYLRATWKDNKIYFFAGQNHNKIPCYFGINDKTLLFCTTPDGIITNYSSKESNEKYKLFYKIFKSSPDWQNILENQIDLYTLPIPEKQKLFNEIRKILATN